MTRYQTTRALRGMIMGFSLSLIAPRAYSAPPSPWPPQIGKPYPDLEMVDQSGAKVKLSSFRGKVLVIEPVGMNCPACLGWSGTRKHGPFQGLQGQADVSPIEDLFPQYAGLPFDDPRIVHIQLLLFSTSMQPTSAADAKAWAAHFGRSKAKNQYVLAGSEELLQPERHSATYNLVPGFQIVDKNFVLRAESVSDNPKSNLWTEVLPQVGQLVRE